MKRKFSGDYVKRFHNGLGVRVVNYNLDEPQNLEALSSDFKDILINHHDAKANQESSELGRNLGDYVSLYVGHQKRTDKAEHFLILPQQTINIPINKPVNSFIRHPNDFVNDDSLFRRVVSYDSNTNSRGFFDFSNVLRLFPHWFYLTVFEDHDPIVRKGHPLITFNAKVDGYDNILSGYAKRCDGQVGFFYSRLADDASYACITHKLLSSNDN